MFALGFPRNFNLISGPALKTAPPFGLASRQLAPRKHFASTKMPAARNNNRT
jgi:hypothetical protein